MVINTGGNNEAEKGAINDNEEDEDTGEHVYPPYENRKDQT